ncbi:MAG: hypothetical protein O3A00_12230 [Planctomycetota bacterium]|nr:hypothetical protein [Planctomycetota bacterium]
MLDSRTEVHAWMVSYTSGDNDPRSREQHDSVFLTEGLDLGQLQREFEMRFEISGQEARIQGIKASRLSARLATA